MDWLLTGFAFGFFGSFHCVGMCGPLAMGLPGVQHARARFAAERLLYNLGRALTYSALGFAVGALGLAVLLAGYQHWLSFGIGVAMVLAAAVPWVSRQFGLLERLPTRFLGWFARHIGTLYQRQGLGGMFAIGVLNGLLPCGFVYAALATAVTAGAVGTSASFMFAFGLGTIPAMFAVGYAGRLLSPTWRARLLKLAPLGLLLVGTLLILRGLSLGVFLSPDTRAALFTPGVCHFLPFVDPVAPR